MGAAALSWLVLRPSNASAITCPVCIRYAQITVNDPNSSATQTLDVWKNWANGRITLQWDGDSSDTTVVTGATATVVSDGIVDSIDDYSGSNNLWSTLNNEYGVSESTIENAVAAGQQVGAEPSDSTASADSLASTDSNGNTTYSSPYSYNSHYSTASALQTALGFPVPQTTSLDGYTLNDATMSQYYGPNTTVSGWYGSLSYGTSSDPNDSVLTVDVAVPSGSSSWGAVYASFVSSTPDLTGPGYAATLVNNNQAVFQEGSTYIAVTAAWEPTTAEWQSILSTLASG